MSSVFVERGSSALSAGFNLGGKGVLKREASRVSKWVGRFAIF